MPAGDYQKFLENRQAIANYVSQSGGGKTPAAYKNEYQDSSRVNAPYSANQGTDYMYNGKYRSANAIENALIDIHRAGDWAMQYQAHLMSGLGKNEEERNRLREEWTFDPNKFKIDDWSAKQAGENFNQIKNFAASLPGQMVGGLIQAPGQLLGEVAFGDPITEYKRNMQGGHRRHGLTEGEAVKDADGNYLIPDYTLDAGQRAAQFVNASINVAGAFTGGGGRVAASLGKNALAKPLARALEGTLDASGNVVTKDVAKTSAKNFARNFQKLNKDERKTVLKNLSSPNQQGARILSDADVGKVEKYADKVAKWERRQKGVVGRIYEETTGKPIDAAGKWAQVGFDALQEAGEEFVQQYAEEGGRYKREVTLNDALTAAAWGFAGGGMMSGVGALRTKAAEISANEQSGGLLSKDQNLDSNFTFDSSDFDYIAKNPGQYRSAVAQRALAELLQRGTKQKGSGVGTNVTWSNDYMGHEGGVGIINIQRSAQADPESMSLIAHDFGIEPKDLSDILSFDASDQSQVEAARQALQEILDKKGRRGLAIAIGRSPSTKNGGAKIYLTKILGSDAIELNPMTYAQYGSDIDGDKSFFYFNCNGRFPDLGFASTFIAEPTIHYDDNGNMIGASNVPYWYSAIGHADVSNPEAIKKVKATIDEVLSVFKTKIEGKSFSDYFSDKIVDALSQKVEDVRDAQLSIVFTEMQHEAEKVLSDYRDSVADGNPDDSIIDIAKMNELEAQGYDIYDGMDVYGRVMQKFIHDPDYVIGTIKQARQRSMVNMLEDAWVSSGQDGTLSEYVDVLVKEKPSIQGVLNTLQDTGSIEGVTSTAQVYHALGLIYTMLVNSGNPIYRQYAQLYYPFGKEIAGKYFEHSEELGNLPESTLRPILETFLRASFGMTAMGVDPTVSINGIITKFIIDDLKEQTIIGPGNGTIRSEKDLQTFYDSVIDVYNKFVPKQNTAMQESTSAGITGSYDAILWKPIDKEKGIDSEEFWNNFITIFGDVPISYIFDKQYLPSRYHNMTINQFIEDYASNPNAFVDIGSAYGYTAFNTFFESIADMYGKNFQKIRNNFIARMGEIDPGDAVEVFEETGKFGSMNTVAIYSAVDAIGVAMDPVMAWRSGFLDPIALMKTKYGQRIFRRDATGEQRANAVCSLNMYTKFKHAYHVLKGMDSKELNDLRIEIQRDGRVADNDELNSLLEELNYLHNIDYLHEVIVSSMLRGDFDLFEILASPDISLDDKDMVITHWLKGEHEDIDFVVSSLTTSDSKFSMGEITTRVNQAKTYIKSANIQINETAVQHVQYVAENTDDASFMEFLKDATLSSMVRYNTESLVGQAWESVITAHEAVEKGTIQVIASNKNGALEIAKNGLPTSYQESLFGETFGEITLDHARQNIKLILDCLHDPDVVYTVKDPLTGREGTMSIYTLLQASGIDINYGDTISKSHYIEFLKKNPNVATYLGKRSVSYTQEGAKVSIDSDLKSNFQEWRNTRAPGASGNKSVKAYQINRGLIAAETWLIDNPKYLNYLYSCIAKEVENLEVFDITKIRPIILRIHEKNVRAFYANAHHISGGNALSIAVDSFIKRSQAELNSRLRRSKDIVKKYLSPAHKFSIQEFSFTEKYIREQQMKDFLSDIDRFTDSELSEITDEIRTYGTSGKLLARESRKAYSRRYKEALYRVDVIKSYLYDTIEKENSNPDLNLFTPKAEDFEEIVNGLSNQYQISIDEAKAIVQQFLDIRFGKSEDIDPSNITGFLITQDDLNDADVVKNKIRKLYEMTGEPVKDKQVDKDYESALKNIKEFNDLWAKRIFAHDIEIIETISHSGVNQNAIDCLSQINELQQEAFETCSETRTSLVDYLNEQGLLFDGSDADVNDFLGNPDFPVADPSSELAQIMISNARIMDDSASTNTQVSLNGSQLKLHHGLGYLPKYSDRRPKPVNVSVNQLEDAYRKNKNIGLNHIIIEGDFNYRGKRSYETITVQAFLNSTEYSQIKEEMKANGEPVQYFNPLHNVHGLTEECTPTIIDKRGSTAGGGRPWHIITHMINKIDVTSMEAMVMKAKKIFGGGKYVVKQRSLNKKNLGTSNEDNIALYQNIDVDPETGSIIAQNAMIDLLTDIRGKYSEEVLMPEFTDSLKSLNWGKPQADLLSCFLCPGLKITIDFNGKTEQRVFDAQYIFNDEQSFIQQYNKLTTQKLKDGTVVTGKIIQVEQFTVTPTDISFRIINAIDHNKRVKKNPTKDRTEKIAERCLDWSSYRFNTLDMSEVLHFIPPCTDAVNFGLKLSDSQNPPQILLDLATGGSFGASKPGVRAISPHLTQLDIKRNANLHANAVNLLNHVETFDEDGTSETPISAIMGIFGKPDGMKRSVIDMEQYNDFVRGLSSDEHLVDDGSGKMQELHYYDGKLKRNSAVIVLSPDAADIQKAVNFAIRSGNDILVPISDINSYPELGETLRRANMKTGDDIYSEVVLDFGGKSPRKVFAHIKIKRDTQRLLQSARMAKSHRITGNPKNVKRTLVDFSNEFTSGDAGIRVTSWGGSNIGIRRGDYAIFSISQMMKNRSNQEVRIIGLDEAKRLISDELDGNTDIDIDTNECRKIFDENLYIGKDPGYETKSLAISRYLKRVANDQLDENGLITNGAGAEQVIGMLYDGEKYMPIFAPKGSMRRYDSFNAYIWGDDLYLPWSGHSTIGEHFDENIGTDYSSVHIKLSAFDQIAFKGIATMMPSRVPGTRSEYKMISNRLKTRNGREVSGTVDFIISGETYGGRAKGRDLKIFKHNLAEANLVYSGSFIYEQELAPMKDENGNIIKDEDGEIVYGLEYRPHIKELIRRGDLSEADLKDLLTNNREAARRLLAGDIIIHDDPEVMALIRMAVQNCYDNNAPWSTVITRINSNMFGDARFDDDRFNAQLVFSGFDADMLCKFYHGMGNFIQNEYGAKVYLTPDGVADTNITTRNPDGSIRPVCLFNAFGESWQVIDKIIYADKGMGANRPVVKGDFYTILWGEPRITGAISDETLPGSQASIAFQQSITSGLDQGFRTWDIEDPLDLQRTTMFDYNQVLLKNNAYATRIFQARAEERRVKGELDWSFLDDSYIELKPGMSWGEYERSLKVAGNRFTLTRPRNIYKTKDGKRENINSKSDEWKNEIQPRIEELKKLLDWDLNVLSFQFVDMFVRQKIGSTVESNSENNDISLRDWTYALDDIIADLRESIESKEDTPLILRVYKNGSNEKDRFTLPWLTDYQLDMLLEHSGYFKKAYNGLEGRELYRTAMIAEGKQALEAIEKKSRSRAQKLRLYEYAEWIHKALNIPFTNNKYLYNGVYTEDYLKGAERLAHLANIIGYIDETEVQELIDKIKDNIEFIKTTRDNLEQQYKDSTVEDPSSPSGISTASYYDVCYAENAVLDRATQWVQFLTMLDPFMTIANIGDRGIHQSGRRLMHRLAKKGSWIGKVFSPYHYQDDSIVLSEEAVHNVANQKDFMELFIAIREAAFFGREREFIAEAAAQGENMLQWLREQRKSGSKWSKIINAGFAFGTGGKFGMKQQAIIFLDSWVEIIEQNPTLKKLWLTKDENGQTILEASILGDGNAVGWLLDCLGGHGGSPVLQETLLAMQMSRSGDLAQKNTYATIIMDKVSRSGAGNLAFATMVTKFPAYSFNILHRMSNWIFPSSTAYYLFTEYMANTEMGQRLNLQTNQMHKSLKQALQVDMLHLGASLMAIVIMGSGMLEPPDDDRYLCNIDEWLFWGHRIRDVWWVHDILGMALPVAIYGKSCLIGKPQVSIMFEGINDACSSNPFLKASDALNMFFDPEGSIFEQYSRAKEEYKDAPGGGPDNIFEFLSANATSGVARIAGQFVTPAFVRELAQLGDYEHSYKYVYAGGKYGGEKNEDKIVRTTYQDAMLRKYLRSNPWLATIMDVLPHGTTGYREDEMPYTPYYDPNQINSMQENALKDPAAIIAIIEKYNGSMDELQATGFYLDPETKKAVSQQIWDNYYSWKSEWNRFAANEGADYTSLGGGDFAYGKQLFYEYKELCESNQRYWRNFYNDNIKNSYLSRPMQMYRRYKTDYELDATGEVYATGYRRDNGFIPFQTAPGTLTDPEGTAGYKNNFDSISAVTGTPIEGMRALVPIEQAGVVEEWPEFEEWSQNKDGNSFSSNYNNSTTTNNNNKTSSSNNKPSGGSRGGGGGGYRRRGGGGGGGGGRRYGSPTKSGTPGMDLPYITGGSTSHIMNADRIQDADTVAYLRPDFETKGSREAYKRSDI